MDIIGLKKERLYSTWSIAKKNCRYVDCYKPLAESSRRFSTLNQGGLGTSPMLSLNKFSREKLAPISLKAQQSRCFTKAATV
ncbi:MAG: hypothetical protein ACK53Y_05830, partial [bacterium]